MPPVDAFAAVQTLAQVCGIAAVALALLVGCGLLLAWMLPRALRRFLPLFAPLLGYALLSGVCHYLAAGGLSLRQGSWLILALAIGGWASVGLDRRLRRAPRAAVRPVLIATAAFLFALLPLFRLGYLTTVGGTVDAISYATRSEYLREAPFGIPEVPPGRPYLSHVAAQIELVRAGDALVVGVVGLFTDRRSHELLTVLPALFFGLLAGGTYVGLRLARCRRGAATLAAALVACNNLLLWPVYDNFLSQAVALSFFPFLVAVAIDGARRPGWRSAGTFGVLLGGLWSTYPIFGGYVLVATLVAWLAVHLLRGWPRRPRTTRLVAWWPMAAAFMILSNAVAVWRSRLEFGFVAALLGDAGVQRVGRGNILVFPPPLELLGLVSHPLSAYTPSWRGFVPLAAWVGIGALAAGAVAYGWWRLPKAYRLAYGAATAAVGALLLQQRYLVNAPEGYPYGYFKVATILAWLVTSLLGVGLAEAARRRSAFVVAAGVAVALLTVQSLVTQRFVLREQLVLSRELIAAGERAAELDDDTWVAVDVPQGMRQHWLTYLLSGQRMAFRTNPYTGEVLASSALPGRPRYALVAVSLDATRATGRDEPFHRPGEYHRLWGNGAYELRRRRDVTRAPLAFEAGPWVAPLEVARTSPPGVAARLDDHTEPLAVEGEARTLQVLALATRATELSWGDDPQAIELPAGGLWTIDLALDRSCLGESRALRPSNGEPLLLVEVAALSTSTGAPGACAEVFASSAGITYLKTESHGDTARFDLLLVPPHRRPYRFGAHMWDGSRFFGVFSLDFPPGEGVRRGVLEVDLSRREARGEVDGAEVSVQGTDFAVDHGPIETSAVWWGFAPIEQLSVESTLWFLRSPDGAISRVRTAPPRLRVLSPP